MTKESIVKLILKELYQQPPLNSVGTAYAPTNIALCKYWGKRDSTINLPMTSSLSITLPPLGTNTEIKINDQNKDRIWLNEIRIEKTNPFYQRLHGYLNLFRPSNHSFDIRTTSSIPIAAGFASSASGFAATILALDSLFGWNLSRKELSILARLGSGSACRSLWSGFVEWQKGNQSDGMDSHGIPIKAHWPDFVLATLIVDDQQKPISSTTAMQHTVETCSLYPGWITQVTQDLRVVKQAIANNDFKLLASTSEANALAMHATMIATQPAVIYWTSQTVDLIHKIHKLRHQGLEIYFTQDAGPNLKLLYQDHNADIVKELLNPNHIIYPFSMDDD